MRENLKNIASKKKDGKIINFLSPSLVIRHKGTKIEYTINKVIVDEGKPVIICYRYYKDDDPSRKVFIRIEEKDFKEYELV